MIQQRPQKRVWDILKTKKHNLSFRSCLLWFDGVLERQFQRDSVILFLFQRQSHSPSSLHRLLNGFPPIQKHLFLFLHLQTRKLLNQVPLPRNQPIHQHPYLCGLYSIQGSDGSGEEESWNQKRSISKKICLSCGTKKTPRWHKSRFLCDRPHELFCNACAIRIKKYHLICAYCHFALNSDQASHGSCPHCHHRFINLIDESEVKMNVGKHDRIHHQAYSNQLDSVLAGASHYLGLL